MMTTSNRTRPQFMFQLGDLVRVTASGEQGEVIGRAEYSSGVDQYLVYYKAADGRAVEAWWAVDRLALIDTEER